MTKMDRHLASIDKKLALLDLKIEALALKDYSGMNKISLYRLLRQKSKMARKFEA